MRGDKVREVPLSNGGGQVALIDEQDWACVKHLRWRLSSPSRETVYAFAWQGKIHMAMHRLLMDVDDERCIDHINGDGLDNRRENLRIATKQENQFNRKSQKGTTSRFKGVSLVKLSGKWVAAIRMHGDIYSLGTFANEIDAARAYDVAATKYQGDFARLNFSPDPDSETKDE